MAVTPLPCCPSPKSQACAVTVPSASRLREPSTATARSRPVAVKDASGAAFCGAAATVTSVRAVPVAPSSSVTVSVTW